jgi:hypothetical protein
MKAFYPRWQPKTLTRIVMLTGPSGDPVVEHLRENGVTTDREPVVGLDGNLQAWPRDPDGNQIELMQLSEESPQRQRTRSAERAGASGYRHNALGLGAQIIAYHGGDIVPNAVET